MGNPLDGNIFSSKESENQQISGPGYDGNYSYPNGTYGQSDYTVRERNDGSGYSDVYCKSDSSRGHSHDVIDKYGNIIDSYHDYLIYLSNMIYEYQLQSFMLLNDENNLSESLTRKLR